jgi:hypothetical protein
VSTGATLSADNSSLETLLARFARIAAVATALIASACLDTSAPNQDIGTPPMSASIEQTPWYATTVLVTPSGSSVALGGGNVGSNAAVTLVIGGSAVGTYTLGPSSTSSGTIGITTGQVWSTTGDSASGSIVITTFEARHIVGTFDFIARPAQGNATGSVHVTEGKFDVSY